MTARKLSAFAGLTLTAIAITSFISVLAARSMSVTYPSAQIQAVVRDFSLNNLDGDVVHLKDFRDQVVVVMFTDPRCPVTNLYNTRINQLVSTFADKPVQFVSIVSGSKVIDPAFLTELRVQRRLLDQRFPTLLDPASQVAHSFGVTQTPAFYVVGRHGVLRYAGALDDDRQNVNVRRNYLQLAIDATLNYSDVQVPETTVNGCPMVP
ncbi:MAG: redoxin domain-containing protein [Phycisphaerales bacterium]|nr:redoxin domain-containing protein [Phycisphaerales bacterium]